MKKFLGKYIVDDEIQVGDEIWRVTIEPTNFYSDNKKDLEVSMTDQNCRDWCMFIVPEDMTNEDIMERIEFIRNNARKKIHCLTGYDDRFKKPLDNDADGVIIPNVELLPKRNEYE